MKLVLFNLWGKARVWGSTSIRHCRKGIALAVRGEFRVLWERARKKLKADQGNVLSIEKILEISKSNFFKTLIPTNQVTMSLADKELIITSSGSDPQLEIQDLCLTKHAQYWLILMMDFPVPTCFQLFCGRSHESYNEADSQRVKVPTGCHRIVVELPDPETIRRIRVDPGDSPGRYILHELSIIVSDRGQRQIPTLHSLHAWHFQPPSKANRYRAWFDVNRFNDRRERQLRDRVEVLGERLPKISVLVPVYNPSITFFEKMIASVRNQVYGNWELCLADDGSSSSDVKTILERAVEQDARIKVTFRPLNGGISEATNTAARMASADILVLLDHDDQLTPNAIGEVAIHFAQFPETDFLYSDHDKIDVDGRRFDPWFKPDWSPELLLSYCYVGHLKALRKSLYTEIGGCRKAFDGAQDHDLALRATEKARQIGHIPLILYHWASAPGSTASHGSAKSYAHEAGRMAVSEALGRRGQVAKVVQPRWARKRFSIFELEFPDDGPSVTIIIPTRNRTDLLRKCISSLQKTSYKNYSILIVDNQSDDPEAISYLDETHHEHMTVRVPDGSFNFSYINNTAAQNVTSDFLLFLNNDTEVIEPKWLSQMVGYALMPGVGAVGAKLVFADDTIQHAGVIQGVGDQGLPDHAFKTCARVDHGYMALASVSRNCSAVTAACMLTPRQLFLEIGGFDEDFLGTSYQDADYCMKLLDRGYRIVYCHRAELYHFEGSSRATGSDLKERASYCTRYRRRNDPFYSPHLTKKAPPTFQIRPRSYFLGRCKAIKAIMCGHNLNWEGAPGVQQQLCLGLKEREVIDPTVISPVDGPRSEVYKRSKVDVCVIDLSISHLSDVTTYDHAIDRLGTHLSELGAEIIYANTLQTWYAVEIAQKLGIPAIWNIHESEDPMSYFDFLIPEIRDRAYDCFAYPYRVVFVSEATRDLWHSLDSKHNFTVIHNALNLRSLDNDSPRWSRQSARKSLNIADREVAILLLGTVCERKGQHDLPLALGRLPVETHDRIRCFIVGDRVSPATAGYRSGLFKIVECLPESLSKRISIVPETPDTERYYKAADIFVCTSRIESYPLVILEAMAYGLPIVTTPVYGIAEQVAPNVNSLIYDPGNIDQLAMHLRRLIVEGKIRLELAGNSTRVLEGLSDLENMMDLYAQIFKEAFLTGGSHRP